MLNEHVARRGLMFALSSPSGAGKSTLARKLIEDDSNMALSVSATTRARSLDEISHWEEYDYVLVNALLEQTLAQIKQILAAERLKRHRQMWLQLHVERLKQGI